LTVFFVTVVSASQEDLLAIVFAIKQRRTADLDRLLSQHGGELDFFDNAVELWGNNDADSFDQDDTAVLIAALHKNATVTKLQLPSVGPDRSAVGELLSEMLKHNSCITSIYLGYDYCDDDRDALDSVYQMCTVRVLPDSALTVYFFFFFRKA
jgi:hypothetical protein